MSELELLKQDLIKTFYEKSNSCFNNSSILFNACDVDSYESYFNCMNNKTFYELTTFLETIVVPKIRKHPYGAAWIDVFKKLIKDATKKRLHILEKEMVVVKDNTQNTADVVNLFTDIDKNRTKLEDKVNKLESKIDKLETSISQILTLLQKS